MTRALLNSLCVLLLCGALAAGDPLLAQQPAPKIIMAGGSSGLTGVTYDAAGDGLAGVTVVVSALEDASAGREVVTDTEGQFRIEGLPFGYYRLSFKYGSQAYPANRVVRLSPGKLSKASFRLGAIEPEDELLGITTGKMDELLELPVGGVARLIVRSGPKGLAWFRTGKGVATLVGGGSLIVAGLIALSDNSSDEPAVSPSSP